MNIEKKSVDWEWANRLPILPIFEAAALSLGYELGALPPVRYEVLGKPALDEPEHGQRTFLAYQYARAGKLKLVGLTGFSGDIFDLKAEFSDGQAWEVELHEFRKFCDLMRWDVPDEFRPIGYQVSAATSPVAAIENHQLQQFRSEQASRAASEKNKDIRTWVLSEWAALPVSEKNKTSFGRQYSQLVKRKFKKTIAPETISRDWLPKV